MDKQGRKKIGLLGGSFNPAHEGHLHISLKAIELLGLDEIWWLVSPQNPIKSQEGMAPFEERFASAEKITRNQPAIIVSDFELSTPSNYTHDTFIALHNQFPEYNFVWLMGADNLANFDKWYKWQEAFALMPIAIFDRGEYSSKALNSPAAQKFAENMLPQSRAKELATSPAPSWCFLNIDKHPASSTQIRQNRQ